MALITVSGVLKDPGGNPIAGSVQFKLVNYAGNVPRVLSTYAFAPTAVTAQAGSTGVWSIGIQGNDTITPSNTYYQVTRQDANGIEASVGAYLLTGSSPINLDSLPTITTPINPPVVAPPFITLENNGTLNSSQSLLNLTSGANVTITDTGGGSISIASTGGGGSGPPFAGANPWRDITAFEGVIGSSCFNGEEINGTISSGSHTLSLASAGSFANSCYVGVAGAGATPSISSPTIASAAFTPATMTVLANGFTRSGNVVTVSLNMDASITAGDSITISGATGCSTSVNGTFTVAATQFPGGNGNKFTFNQTAGNETCGGTNLDGTSPATIVVNAGSTHYDYQVCAMDYLNGLTAPSASVGITNGPATLAGQEPITITINEVGGQRASVASYPVYRRTGGSGSYVYIGSALPIPNGYSRTTTSIVDYGQGYPGQVLLPINVPSTVPSGTTGQILISQISSGGGTTTLTLATPASNNATTQTVYHDNSTAFNAVLTQAKADIGVSSNSDAAIVYIPPNVMPKFINVNFGATAPGTAVYINVAGGLWPVGVMHRTASNYVFNGISGSGASIGNTGQIGALIVTGDVNPTLFDDLQGQAAVINNFTFSNNPSGQHGLTSQTAIYMANNEGGIYSNIRMGGSSYIYSPLFFADGSSGSGGNFNTQIYRMEIIGGSRYPVPGALFRGCGNVIWTDGFFNNRGVKIDYTTAVASGGGYKIQNIQTEALVDPYLFQADFTNTQNNGGMFFDRLGISDFLYSVPQIVQLKSASGNGLAHFTGINTGATLVGIHCFDSIVVDAVGSMTLGSQAGCPNHQIGQNAWFAAQGAANNQPGLAVVSSTLQAGLASPSNATDTHHFYDPVNGGNGLAVASIGGGAAGFVQRLDTAHASGQDSREFPTGGSWTTYWQPKTGNAATLSYDDPSKSFTWQVSGTAIASSIMHGNATGGLTAGDFTWTLNGGTPRLVLLTGNSSVNWGAFTGTFTGSRVLTMPDASGTLSLTNVFNHSGTQTAATHIVQDTATLSGGTLTVTLTGSSVFTSKTTYSCSAVDTTTPANAVTITQTSGSSITFAGTGTDVISYSCIGS